MIATSAAYKNAIKINAPQRALIRFKDAVFTNEDISITSGGITFEDRFNEETEMKFGVAPSNSIEIALINTDGLLNNYAFGRFQASIGVQTAIGTYQHDGNVTVEIGIGGKRFSGHDEMPYLRENGEACQLQPSFPVKSIVVNDAIVYCFGQTLDEVYAFSTDGDTWEKLSVYTWDELSEYTWNALPNEYVEADAPIYTELTGRKVERLIEENTGIVVYGDVVAEFFANGAYETYEHVKLGTFVAPRPAQLRKRVVSVVAEDLMQLFANSLIDDVGLKFPITLRNMLRQICEYQGVELNDKAFIGGDTSILKRPDAFDEATQQEVIAWIAEVACAYAKINRLGQLEFRWFSESGVEYDEQDYKDFVPLSYQVPHVAGMKIRNGDSYTENSYGEKTNVYLIQDNPFLRPDDEISFASVETYNARNATSHPILIKAESLPDFYPSSSTLFGDPSIEAGDIVTIRSESEPFLTPIYSARTEWTGTSIVTIDNSGSEERPAVAPLKERQEFTSGRQSYSARNSIGAIGKQAQETQEQVNYAFIDINKQESKILLMAGVDSMEDIDGSESVKQAYIEINGANEEITLRAKTAYVDAEITNVKKLIAAEIEATKGTIETSIAETVTTGSLTSNTATIGALTLGGDNVIKKSVAVVTEFTQASGESASTVDYTFLVTSFKDEVSHEVEAGKTITF